MFEPPPEELCKVDGVAGVLLLQNGRTLVRDLPLGDEQSTTLATLVRKMCEGYRKARRIMRQVIITYPSGIIMIHSREEVQLVLLLLDENAIDAVSEVASEYLKKRFTRPLRLPLPPAAA